MPYIIMSRTDIPDGVLQVLDLWPNTSLRVPSIEPPGQTRYVGYGVVNEAVDVAANVTVAAYNGLAAYLIDHVADGVTTNCLSDTIANASAAAIVARLVAGTALDAAGITAALVFGGAGVGTTVVGGGGAGVSCGAVLDVIKILAGASTFALPAGTAANSGAAFKGAAAGTLTAVTTYLPTYDTGALKCSYGNGQLSVFASAAFTYNDIAARALQVYNNDGSVYTV